MGVTVILPTRAFAVDADGPFALRSWNFETAREELVSVEGRVLVFENRQRIRDFFGHLTGKGRFGNRFWGYKAVQNMEPVPYRPKPGDMWCAEWYAKWAGDESLTERRQAGLGGVPLLVSAR